VEHVQHQSITVNDNPVETSNTVFVPRHVEMLSKPATSYAIAAAVNGVGPAVFPDMVRIDLAAKAPIITENDGRRLASGC
jgi:hypothetical protein